MQPPNEENSVKKLRCIQRSVDRHWVGDGFPVRTLFSYPNLGPVLSPFLLLDYAGPMEFPPTNERRGVGEHPHRGFETVTIVYEGEVEHRDSSGGGGSIGPGDVQWMTAASGLVHEEFHGREFARRGGMFEMVQLWVNLPAKDKMAPPRYQGILNSQIPAVSSARRPGNRARDRRRVRRGEGAGQDLHAHPRLGSAPRERPAARPCRARRLHDGARGAQRRGARERLRADRRGGGRPVRPRGETICIDSAKSATALLLSGEPIDEPIVGSGPFVMNTPQEIRQAMADYQSGKMGRLS